MKVCSDSTTPRGASMVLFVTGPAMGYRTVPNLGMPFLPR